MDGVYKIEIPETFAVKFIENINQLAGILIGSNPVLKSLQEQVEELKKLMKKCQQLHKIEAPIEGEAKQAAAGHQSNLNIVTSSPNDTRGLVFRNQHFLRIRNYNNN